MKQHMPSLALEPAESFTARDKTLAVYIDLGRSQEMVSIRVVSIRLCFQVAFCANNNLPHHGYLAIHGSCLVLATRP